MKLKHIPKYWKWVKREWKLYNDNKVFSKEYAKISLDFEIPENILKKYHDGKIMVQHICDLMVVSILAEHGGFFTGATVYWTQDVEKLDV